MLAQAAAELFGLDLSAQQVAAFETYAAELAEWNEKINLTAITEPDAVRVRHFLDSLSLVTVCPMRDGLRLIDVGTGAGLPGLPLAILYPQIHVTLLEATGKKVTFLDHMVQVLGLDNVQTVKARAEEAGQDAAHRARYDVVVARAVARMPVLVEYLLPLAKVGGLCIAMKGVTAQTETDDAARALGLLGGRVHRIESVALPDVDDPHYLVVIEKTDPTPKAYPRKPGIPAKSPLG